MPLQDTDNLIVGRGTDSYKITYEALKDKLEEDGLGTPTETVNAPTLLTPADGATDVSNTSVTLSCSAYSGVSSVYGTTTWEISSASDFSALVYNETNTDETSTVASFTLEFETTYYARCKHTSSTGIASAYSNVNEFETQADPVDPNVPNATMSGLRFDSARETALEKTLDSGETWTMSFWAKPGKQTGAVAGFLMSASPISAAGPNLLNADNTLRFNDGATHHIIGPKLTENVWVNVVITCKDNEVNCFVNGDNTGSATIAAGTGKFEFTRVGGHTSNYYNGYLSEFYFAEEILPPTVFGKAFPDGRWGPLDSAEILDNINNAAKNPDGLSNTSQVWSDLTVLGSGVTTNAGEPIENIYNGEDTFCRLVGGAVGTGFTLTPVGLTASTVAIKISNGTNAASTIVVNGTEYETAAAASDKEITANLGSPTTISTIGLVRASGSDTYGANYIKVDGRILVDQGVWNTSQNWSEAVSTQYNGTGTKINDGYQNVFDGDITTRGGYSTNNSGTENQWSFTFDNPINVSSSVVLITNSNENHKYWKVNNLAEVQASVSPNTITFNFTGTLDSVSGRTTWAGGNGLDLSGIIVDGVLLVDAGTTWNTSQIWSDTNPGPTAASFDGDLTTYAAIPQNTIYTFSTPITFTDKVEVCFVNNTSGWQVAPKLQGSSAANFVNSPGDTSPVTIASGGGVLEGWQVQLSPETYPIGVAMFIVDGEILVDKSSFGANGFYLPFDPAASPALRSDNVFVCDTSGTILDGISPVTPQNIFNGDVTNFATVPSNNQGLLITRSAFGPFGALQLYNSGTTEMTARNSAGGSQTFGPSSWNVLGDTDVDYVYVFNSDGSPVKLGGIMMNNIIISSNVVSNSIGVDASGNENNFHDENFVVGNTSQVWSSNSSGTPFNSDYDFQSAFDSNTTNTWAQPADDDSMTVNFQGLTDITSCEIIYLCQGIGVTAGGGIKVNNNSATLVPSGSSPQTLNVTNLLTADELTKIEIIRGSGVNSGVGLFGVRVNGEVLVDANIQDTVTDTPLKNYAVLDTSQGQGTVSNGNLVIGSIADARGSVEITENTYFETAVNAIGSGFIVGITKAASGGSHGDGNYLALDHTGKVYNSSGGPTDVGLSPFEVGDVIGVTYDTTNVTWYKNGVQLYQESSAAFSTPLYAFGHGNDTNIAFNFGQQPFVYTPPAGYEDLFQTWDEWATLGLFFFNENTGKTITSFELNRKYGLTAASPDAGIYDLTFQPRAQVLDYLKQATTYLPLEDLLPQLEATQAELVQVKAERDEAKDKLDEQITKLADRIALVEAEHTTLMNNNNNNYGY